MAACPQCYYPITRKAALFESDYICPNCKQGLVAELGSVLLSILLLLGIPSVMMGLFAFVFGADSSAMMIGFFLLLPFGIYAGGTVIRYEVGPEEPVVDVTIQARADRLDLYARLLNDVRAVSTVIRQFSRRYTRGIPASSGSVGRHGSEEELNMAAPAPSLSPRSYTWTFPGCPIQIRLRLELVDALQRLVGWAEDAGMPAPAPFCGGLLLGDTASPGVTTVAGMEPLPALDTATVEAAIGSVEGEVVGFFRAVSGSSLQLGTGLRMTNDDVALAAGLFHQPSSVVLLIETAGTAAAKAAFFFWDAGKMLGDFSLMDFPLDSHQLTALERQRTAPRAGHQIDPEMNLEPAEPPRFHDLLSTTDLLGQHCNRVIADHL